MATYSSFKQWLDQVRVNLNDTQQFENRLVDNLKDNLFNQKFAGNTPALKPDTIRRKRKRGNAHPTTRLFATGELFNNTTGNTPEQGIVEAGYTDKVHFDSSRRSSGKNRRTHTYSDLATIHNKGGGNVPQAEFVYVNEDCIRDLEDIFVSKFN